MIFISYDETDDEVIIQMMQGSNSLIERMTESETVRFIAMLQGALSNSRQSEFRTYYMPLMSEAQRKEFDENIAGSCDGFANITPQERNSWGVHARHCCVIHGCKYGDDDCPVYNRQVLQDAECESCGEDNING